MIVVCPLLGWIAGVNTFHDASHFALSTNPAVNAVGGALFPQFASMYAWYHQHIIGHHVHTNMPYHDPDLVHGTDIRREHDLHPLEPLHRNQDNLVRTAWHFMVGSWLGLGGINDMKLIFSSTKSYNGFIPRIPATNLFLVVHVVSRVLYYLAQFGWPFYTFSRGTPFLYRLAFALLPAMIHSVLFMINTQINHLSPGAMKANSHDWTVHQIITAQNFGRLDDDKHQLAWLFHFTMSGGLNLQMEHHIFPTVNHCHLPAVARILRPLCIKYGVPYNEVPGYYEGMREYIKHSTMKGGKPLPALVELELLKPDEQSKHKERGEHVKRSDTKQNKEESKQEHQPQQQQPQQQQHALKKTTRTGSISPADIASLLILAKVVNPVVASLAEQKKEV
ncbi:hypothetical protein HK100_005864 [Physocladia obscura]|uniref:Fatty acid desaturase domain-containing protein n=1 Tax=Physocladia obscura TaxID=109957 RepID=A0AAD5STB4_9FUNG|nr:hypothetical protein HK100_005864 [Physocladia obscura]